MTHTIVARNPETREMGVATQSQVFAVGNSVPFALPGGHGVNVDLAADTGAQCLDEAGHLARP